jgi:hypothetical protein
MNISTCDKEKIYIFAYSETQSRDLTVPSIGQERVSTVAKPELKAAVKIYGIFRYVNSEFCTREIAVKIPKIPLIIGRSE